MSAVRKPRQTMLDWALGYAGKGIPVFPLVPQAKEPLIKGGQGYKDATTDEAQLRAWWAKEPRAGIGIPMVTAGLLALDIDPRNGGDYDALTARYGELPMTLTSQTGGGGLHLLFRHPGGELRAHVPEMPGIDVKVNGYIVAPPSIHPSGTAYQWLGKGGTPLELPASYVAFLRRPERATASNVTPMYSGKPDEDTGGYWLDKAMQRTSQGNGDHTGYWLAQQLLVAQRAGKSVDVDGMLEAYADFATVDSSHPFDEQDAARWLRSASNSSLVARGELAKSQKPRPIRPLQKPRESITETSHSHTDYTNDGGEPPNGEESARHSIVAKGRQLHEITTDAIGALHETNMPPFLFQRSGAIVRMVTDENHRPRIDEVDEKALTCRMTDVADFVRMVKSGSGEDVEFVPVAISPPLDVVKNVLAQPSWNFPALVGITEAPYIRSDGSLVTTPGYDAAARLIYNPAPGLTIPRIPAKPTKADTAKALTVLDDVLADFPFDGEASKAHALALLLVSVVRPAIHGLVPMALVTAPAAGTGKGLLTSIAVTVNTGRSAAMMVAADNEEEWRKRITATLMDGPSFVIIDDIRGVLSSASLQSVLTANVWKDRILGVSKNIDLPQRAVWLATGNNLQLGGDMPRRCYRIRLDAKTARPERREGFKHPDLKAYVTEQRGEVLGALLTIARAWYADGCPSYKVTPMGTYEEWSHTIGCILAHVGISGFLSNLDEMYEEADTERPQWAAFFAAWHQVFGAEMKTASQVATYICNAGDDNALRGALPDEFAPSIANAGALTKRLAYKLRNQVEVRYESANYEVWLNHGVRDKNLNTTRWHVSGILQA